MSNFNISNLCEVYIYYRVSTNGQADHERYGLTNQTNTCEHYSRQIFKKNENQINYYCDIGSSYNDKNKLKQQVKMVNQLCYGSVILIHDVSRLGRNIGQVFKILQKVRNAGSYIISLEDNVCYGKTRLLDKKFWYKIIEAEESSDKKSSRMINHIESVRAQGGHIGATPYGYKKEKMNGISRLCKDIVEQKAIKTILTHIRIIYNLLIEYSDFNLFKTALSDNLALPVFRTLSDISFFIMCRNYY